jgi:hypothetical protein
MPSQQKQTGIYWEWYRFGLDCRFACEGTPTREPAEQLAQKLRDILWRRREAVRQGDSSLPCPATITKKRSTASVCVHGLVPRHLQLGFTNHLRPQGIGIGVEDGLGISWKNEPCAQFHFFSQLIALPSGIPQIHMKSLGGGPIG